MPARKVCYNLLSQIKLFELKKRTNIRMYAQEKIPAQQPIAQVTDIGLRFLMTPNIYIIAQVTYRL